MALDVRYPGSIKAGKPILEPLPKGWKCAALNAYLEPVARRANLKDGQKYRLVTVKRSRGGVVQREWLSNKDISVKTQFYIEEGDFLISKRQIVHGACGIVPEELAGSIVSNEYCVFRGKENFHLPYIKYLSATLYFQQTCFHSSIGVHVEKMIFKLESWFKWKFNIPPLYEQKRIARLLSTWDEAITVTENLLVNSERRKKAMMQRLLTGGTRLPGFDGEWVEKRLSTLSSYIKGYTYKSEDYSDSPTDIGFLTLKSLQRGGGYSPRGMKYLKVEVDEKYLVEKGDIVFAVTDITRGAEIVGAPLIVPELGVPKVAISMDMVKLEVNPGVSSNFLYYALKLRSSRNFMRARASGSTVLHLDVKGSKKLKIRMPKSRAEQDAISQCLLTLDEHIAGLKLKIRLLKEEREALIQQLLTGKRRVIIEEEAEATTA